MLTTHYKITVSWHPRVYASSISPRVYGRSIDCDTRRKERTEKGWRRREEKKEAQWDASHASAIREGMHVFISHRYSRRPRSRAASAVAASSTMQRASISRKYVLSKHAARHSARGVRAYHDLDSVARESESACFDIAREEHVSARRGRECPCEKRGIREEKEINIWDSKDISLISEIVRGEPGYRSARTITLECARFERVANAICAQLE